MMQITDTVLLIRMATFRSNEQTAENNYYQKRMSENNDSLISRAQQEFDEFVAVLDAHKINTIVIDGQKSADTPDAHFPNNWVTFHQDGTVALYPMFATNRRRERRHDIIDKLETMGYLIDKVIDYSQFESEEKFLEGTGSIIMDRKNRKAYCALSPRANKSLFLKFCDDFNFSPIALNAYQTVDNERLPIYHTNVMMAIGETMAIVCLDAIDDFQERESVVNHLTSDGKEVIAISETQVASFAGNMLEVRNAEGIRYLVMSKSAYDSLSNQQLNVISNHSQILHSDLTLIEQCGGGSARCMMAEMFLPLRT